MSILDENLLKKTCENLVSQGREVVDLVELLYRYNDSAKKKIDNLALEMYLRRFVFITRFELCEDIKNKTKRMIDDNNFNYAKNGINILLSNKLSDNNLYMEWFGEQEDITYIEYNDIISNIIYSN